MTKKEREDVIDTMKNGFDSDSEPKVGIFWYDPDAKGLFGVIKISAKDLPFNAMRKKTVSTLHKHQWHEERKIAQRYGAKLDYFDQDYTRVPRGRIFEFKNSGFKIMVGSWINDFSEAKELIVKEFNLGNVNPEWVQDEHWDIGRGWSDEFV